MNNVYRDNVANMGPTNNIVWNFFDVVDESDKMARCKVCKNVYSFKTSSGNLKSHLNMKHNKSLTEYREDCEKTAKTFKARSTRQSGSHPLWKFCKKIDLDRKRAKCDLCSKTLSYSSTTTNLKKHLKSQHSEAYDLLVAEMLEWNRDRLRRDKELDEINDDEFSGDESEPESFLRPVSPVSPVSPVTPVRPQRGGVWRYYEQTDTCVRCVVCRTALSADVEQLRTHLQSKHPKLLFVENDSDSSEHQADADSSHEPDNVYSEVVYLEEDTCDNKRKSTNVLEDFGHSKKLAGRNRQQQKKRVKKNARNGSRRVFRAAESEIAAEPEKAAEPEPAAVAVGDEEIDNFGKYVTSLLKKMPRQLATKLQMDIVNLIMTAKLGQETGEKKKVTDKRRMTVSNAAPVANQPNLPPMLRVTDTGNSALTADQEDAPSVYASNTQAKVMTVWNPLAITASKLKSNKLARIILPVTETVAEENEDEDVIYKEEDANDNMHNDNHNEADLMFSSNGFLFKVGREEELVDTTATSNSNRPP